MDTTQQTIMQSAETISQSLRENAWMTEQRAQQAELFSSLSQPTRSDEGWRRADISDLNLNALAEQPNEFEASFGDECNTARERGVFLGSVATAVGHHPEMMRGLFAQIQDDDVFLKLTSMARALYGKGSAVVVPEGYDAPTPIRMLSHQAGAVGFTRNLVVLQPHSRLLVVDDQNSPDGVDAFHSGVTDLFVGEGAELVYVQFQRWGHGMRAFQHQRAVLSKDASLTTITVALGGKQHKAQVESALSAPGASSNMLGLVFGNQKQQFDIRTVLRHISADTQSDLLFKSALEDEAYSVYSGLIRIDFGAQRTNAYQKNENLLLSSKAHAEALPDLEILADDVKCSHGATISPVDDEMLFYLASRGMDKRSAERLIVEGFFRPVIDRIISEEMQDIVTNELNTKIRHQ